MRIHGAVLLAAVVTTACSAAHRPPAGSAFVRSSLLTPPSAAEEAHDALLRADIGRADLVAQRGYGDGLAALFTDDVVYLRGGLPIVAGRAAAQAVVSAESLGAHPVIRWQPVRVDVSADGRSGFSYGYAIFGAAQPAPSSIRVDRYIAFWRRIGDVWRIAAYTETYGDLPPPLALPTTARAGVVSDVPMPRARGALEAIRAADASFSDDAARLGTGDAFGRYAADDAQIFSRPGEFISGPRAITQSFGPPTANSSLVWHPVRGEASQAGDLGFTVGNAVFTGVGDDGATTVRYSKYMTVWKKQRDGQWRYVVDGGSARPGG